MDTGTGLKCIKTGYNWGLCEYSNEALDSIKEESFFYPSRPCSMDLTLFLLRVFSA
jgi:hypothetical protein